MWLIFAVISLLCYAFSDLLGKKHTDSGDVFASVKLIASVNALACLTGFVMYCFGLGESGIAPWQLVFQYPMILLSVVCFLLYWLFFLLSIRYVGLSVDEAVQSNFGAFYFFGLLFVNLFTGKLKTVGGLLHPCKVIPVIFIVVFTVLLPNIEVFAQRKQKKSLAKVKAERRKMVIGLTLLLLSTIFDSLDSLFATMVLEDGNIGIADYMQTIYFIQGLTFIMLSVFVMIKTKKVFIPFVNCGKQSGMYAVVAMLSSVFYFLSCSYDAVRTGVLFIAYPIVPIVGAKILLKEKYTVRQNVIIWAITVSAILFCIADSVL